VIARQELHGHGHVVLEAMLGNELSIVNNARVSFDQESGDIGDSERGLLNFLMENSHGSPWEAVVFRWDIKAPLFVIREFQRHRIMSFNEQSARYSQIPDHYFVPDRIRTQVGKPGKYTFEDEPENSSLNQSGRELIDVSQRSSFYAYNKLLNMGVAKEQARIVLPVGMFSRMKVTVNLRSLFNFLQLRNHPHAQQEIREIAIAMEQMAAEQLPVTFELFEKHGRVCP
jgi:thymidylate synthase (FAD)